MMLVGGRTPNKIMFAKDSGKVYQSEFMPVYNEKAVLDKLEYVPFRWVLGTAWWQLCEKRTASHGCWE